MLLNKELILETEYLLVKDHEKDYLDMEKFHKKEIIRFDYKIEYVKDSKLMVVSKSELDKNEYVHSFNYVKLDDNSWLFSNMNNVIFDIISWEANNIKANISIDKEEILKFEEV